MGLSPWKPGQSGNPKGRVKYGIAKCIRDLGRLIPEGESRERNEKLADILWKIALGDDKTTDVPRHVAIMHVLYYTDGKPTECVEHSLVDRRGELENLSDKELDARLAEHAGIPSLPYTPQPEPGPETSDIGREDPKT